MTDPIYDGYQRGLSSMVYNFFDKKSAWVNKSSGSGIVNEAKYQLANFITKKFFKKSLSQFRYNIWGIEEIVA